MHSITPTGFIILCHRRVLLRQFSGRYSIVELYILSGETCTNSRFAKLFYNETPFSEMARLLHTGTFVVNLGSSPRA